MLEQKNLLEVNSIGVYYGAIRALEGVSLLVPEGRSVVVIGRNGAGKSTLLNTIVGLLSQRTGDIIFQQQRINRWSTTKRVKAGIVLVPEGRGLFPELTVKENLMLGAYLRKGALGVLKTMDEVFHLFPILKDCLSDDAASLSGGQQQMLALGRALISQGKLLMLDEPSHGLSPLLVSEIISILLELKRRGTTILLAEQNVAAALSVADYGYVLENGRVVYEGNVENLRRSEEVRKAYLGG
jgi:branched-chain amino acid transport system ATP-binding protein